MPRDPVPSKSGAQLTIQPLKRAFSLPERGFAGAGQALPDAAAGDAAGAAADRLALGVFLAAVIHALLILGVTFGPEEHERAEQRSIDVILAQARSPSAPHEARYFAEADQLGADIAPEPHAWRSPPAGDPASGVPAPLETAPPPAGVPRAEEVEEIDTPRIAPPSPLSQTRVRRDHVVPERVPEPDPRMGSRSAGPTAVASADEAGADPASAARLRARAMEELSTEIARRLQAYRERPRREWIATRARAHDYASYMEEWRRKVERIGNLHYPEEARRLGLSGSLSLDVALNADGTVADIVLRRSSGERVLDEAAARIVRLAAPFPEFPPAMRDEIDVLHIERTWRFSSRNRFSSR